MEVVGEVASATQLGAYSSCVAGYLLRLYRAVQEGPSTVKDRLGNVKVLIGIISRIASHALADEELLIPLLIDLATIARVLSDLLDRRGQLQTAWTLFVKGDKIEDAFKALNEKSKLLLLCLAEQSQRTLGRVQSGLELRGQSIPCRPTRRDLHQCAQMDANDQEKPKELANQGMPRSSVPKGAASSMSSASEDSSAAAPQPNVDRPAQEKSQRVVLKVKGKKNKVTRCPGFEIGASAAATIDRELEFEENEVDECPLFRIAPKDDAKAWAQTVQAGTKQGPCAVDQGTKRVAESTEG